MLDRRPKSPDVGYDILPAASFVEHSVLAIAARAIRAVRHGNEFQERIRRSADPKQLLQIPEVSE